MIHPGVELSFHVFELMLLSAVADYADCRCPVPTLLLRGLVCETQRLQKHESECKGNASRLDNSAA